MNEEIQLTRLRVNNPAGLYSLPSRMSCSEAWGFLRGLECAGAAHLSEALECGESLDNFQNPDEFKEALSGFIAGVRGAIHWLGDYSVIEDSGLRAALVELMDLWRSSQNGWTSLGGSLNLESAAIAFKRLCSSLKAEFAWLETSSSRVCGSTVSDLSPEEWGKMRNLLWDTDYMKEGEYRFTL